MDEQELEKFENTDLLLLEKYRPDYVISFDSIKNIKCDFHDVLLVFYSLVNNTNYPLVYFCHSLSYNEVTNKQDILSKDFCGFSPSRVLVFKITKKNAIQVIEELKKSKIFKNDYLDCL